jgi:hypothetical protein
VDEPAPELGTQTGDPHERVMSKQRAGGPDDDLIII